MNRKKITVFLITLCLCLSLFGEGSFFEETFESAASLEVSGSLESEFFFYPDYDHIEKTAVDHRDTLSLNLLYPGDSIDIVVETKLKSDELQEGNWQSTLAFSEAYGRYYFTGGDIEFGLLKPIWGSGDGVHVLDVLTPIDYSRFTEPEYSDRKQSMPMVKLLLDFLEVGRFEFAYVPYFQPDYYPMEGRWTQQRYAALQEAGALALETWADAYYQAAKLQASGDEGQAALATIQALEAAKEKAIRIENTKQIQYSQAAMRYLNTFGTVDLGIIAYTGFMKTPVVKSVDLNPSAITAASDPHVAISFNRCYTLGLDLSGAIGGFGYRAEFAGTFTEDLDGDDPEVRNPKLEWLAGVDRELGVANLYVNLQTKGEYILMNNGIDSSLDADYRDDYHQNTLMGKLSTTGFSEKLEAALVGAYVMEDSSYRIKPSLSWTFEDIFTLEGSYVIFGGDDKDLFGQFDGNDSLSISGKLSF